MKASDAQIAALATAGGGAADEWVSVGVLLAESDEPPRWLVDGLLPDGGTSFLVAKPKVGKSTLAQNLIYCIALGEPFLERSVIRGPVLYLALEEKRAELRRRFAAMGAKDGDEIEFYISRAPEGAFEWLNAKAVQRKPALIVVDTFQRFARLKDLNDYASVTNALDPLTHLARESGAHLMLLHHEKKAGGKDGDGVLGSTALFGGVDTLLQMRRRDGARSLSSIQRYGDDMEPTIVALDSDTYRISAQGSTAEADRKRVETEMLACLEGVDEPLTREKLLAGIGARHEIKIAALKHLVESGDIARSGSGHKGDPFLYSLQRVGLDSSIPVPVVYREPENQNRKMTETPHEIDAFSGSRVCEDSRNVGNKNPAHVGSSDNLFAYARETLGFAEVNE